MLKKKSSEHRWATNTGYHYCYMRLNAVLFFNAIVAIVMYHFTLRLILIYLNYSCRLAPCFNLISLDYIYQRRVYVV